MDASYRTIAKKREDPLIIFSDQELIQDRPLLGWNGIEPPYAPLITGQS